MNINQLVSEAVNNKSVPIYHYLFDSTLRDKIIKSGKLLPVNKLLIPRQVQDYASRALEKKLPGSDKNNSLIENANVYWEYMYDVFYKPFLHTPYANNFGIYLTPVDLFSFPNELQFRFVYTLDQLSKDTVIRVGSKGRKVNSDKDIIQVMKKFQDPTSLESIWNKSKLKFIRLPQIVTFSPSLPINNLEARSHIKK